MKKETFEQICKPQNMSWHWAKYNLKNIITGSLIHFLRHPIGCFPAFVASIASAVFKRQPKWPLVTAEGFELRSLFEFWIYRAIFIERNLHHRQMVRELKKAERPVVVDVGASYGFFSQWATQINPAAACYCFEPQPDRYYRSMELFRHGFCWVKAAVGNNNCEANFFISQANCSLQPGDEIIEKEKVNVVTLDSQGIRNPFLVKIDTDGSNLKVIQGARELLKKTKWVLIEDEEGCREELEALGFLHRGKTSPCDSVYLNVKVWYNYHYTVHKTITPNIRIPEPA